MRKYKVLILFLAFIILLPHLKVHSEVVKSVTEEELVNPLEVKKIVLANGLTVYLNEDHSKPEITGSVVVRAGSRNDPPDATGIAHYFEHIMFKGTDRIGTINWETEKLYLDSISNAYDKLAETTDQQGRLSVQKEINRLSIKAAEYAIPNETDVILRDIGGSNLNAGTGYEMTVYYNSFPSFQLEKWIEVYAERFRNPVFRLFQSELETVYEEKNLYSDVPIQSMIEDFFKVMFKDHPYANPIIGHTEHLKNPRLSQMMEFFNTWYVANNMALILAGSFNSDEAIKMIEARFGTLRSAELPEKKTYELPAFMGREFREVRMSPIRIGIVGFRSVPAGHPDDAVFELASQLLSNRSGTGIFDQMTMQNKVMSIQPISLQAPDHGSYVVLFLPKIIGQSLKSAETMVDKGLGQLKAGSFSDELFEAVKLEYRKTLMRQLETPENRADLLMDAFINGQEWSDLLDKIDQIEKVSKDDIMRVAQAYFGPNRLVYWSKMGSVKKDKLEKPDWQPIIPHNTEARSEFAQMIDNMPELPSQPKFVQFGTDVKYDHLRDGYLFYHTNNPYNDIFTLRIDFHKGILHNQLLESTAEYMNLIGTQDNDFNRFKSALQNIGASISFTASDNFFSINIEGFDQNMPATLELLSEMLQQPSADDKQLQKLWLNTKTRNKMRRDDPMEIGDALFNYSIYGSLSPALRNISFKESKSLKSNALLNAYKDALLHEATIVYTGSLPMNELSPQLSRLLEWNKSPVKADYIEHPRRIYNENTVIVNHNPKARQSNINFFVEGETLPSAQDKANVAAFNEYFGAGMSSLVFQEIREFRSLSYAAYARYRQPILNQNKGYLMGYMNTQSDKTLEGIEAMSSLFLDMPLKPERIDGIRKGMIQSVYTSRPSFREMGSYVARWRRQGFDKDPSEVNYPYFQKLEFNEIDSFYKMQLSGKPLVVTVSGNLKTFDRSGLEQFGKVIEVKYQDFIKD